MEIVRKANLCFNCLGRHRISQCRSKARCRHCRGKHHSSLCETTVSKDQDNTGKKATASTVKQNNSQDDSTTSLTVSVPSKPPGTDLLPGSTACLLKTAIAEVRSGPNHSKAQILFDEGAQRSFITQQLADSLKVDSCKCQRICISAFGGEAIPRESQSTSIAIQTNDGGEVPVSVLVVPKIVAPLQNAVPLPGNQYPHLHGLQLAHPVESDNKFEITLLVGADFYWNLVQDKIIRGNGPTAVESKIGYLLSGPLSPSDTKASVSMFHTSVMQCNEPKFWDTEQLGTSVDTQSLLNSTQQPTSFINCSVRRDSDGSYIVGFPWKTDHPPLPSSHGVCEKRARSLARKLAQTPELLKTYSASITDQLSRGFIEKVKEADVLQNCHFIPHHAVKKDSSTTPVRIVYDCSCHLSPNHPSLNDCLVVGPPFLIDMVTLLLRFHTHKYALTTDIEKAFLHVQLAEEDRSYTHFLWLSELDNPNSDLTIFRFRVVLFGSVSSPFMLHTALRHHLTTETSTTASDILTNLYVDNVVSGCTNETSAVDYYTEARELMSKVNFNLRSWASNSPNLMTKANHDQVADTNAAVNVLGLVWNTASDTLSLMPRSLQTFQTTQPTKRTVLQDLSKIFDPLGTLTPVTISAKLFMQQLWQQKLRWNEPLNSTLTSEWHCITGNLTQTPQYHIPHWYLKSINTEQLTLHVFVDASMKAYGAVAYICDDTHSSFAIAKARVAPLKNHTLPRLELMAAVTGSRLCKFVISSLDRFQFKITMWSDSQIVLCWISNKKKLPPFVANRVNEIHDLVPTATWMYCPTQDNPGDLVTRGISFDSLRDSWLWQYGPTWLTCKSQWPKWEHSETLHLQAEEGPVEEPRKVDSVPPHQHDLCSIMDIDRYSTLQRLLRVSAYVLRFIHNCKQSNPSLRRTGQLLPNDIDAAFNAWVHCAQRVSFPEESLALQTTNKTSRPPLIRQLKLFLDKDYIIRCGGRIHNAKIDSETKFPCLLPKKHPLTALVVHHTHKIHLHTGVNATVTSLRQKFWIPSARQVVRSLLWKCVTCRRVSGKSY